MAEEILETVKLRDDFYRDSFGKVVFVIICLVVAIAMLVALSIYFYLKKPEPIVFPVAEEWRVQPPVPLMEPYLSIPDLLQWVSNAIPNAFVYDFNNYNDQLKNAAQYFTSEGWSIFLGQLNIYANYNTIKSKRLFVRARVTGAPFIVNQGILSGRYTWWVQMPIEIIYDGYSPPATKNIKLQVLITRVSTLNNLMGVGINNVIVVKN